MKNWKEDRSRFMEAVCDHFPGGVMVYRDDEEKAIIFGNQMEIRNCSASLAAVMKKILPRSPAESFQGF